MTSPTTEECHLHQDSMLVHHTRCQLQQGNDPLVTPLYQSVKYCPQSMGHLRQILKGRNQGFLYSRVSNPTVRELETLLASLQGQEDALTMSSGIAALTAVAMTFLKAEDRVVLFTESYKPTRFLLGTILKKFQVEAIRLNRNEYGKLQKLCESSNPPKLIFLESPTNPALRLHDLELIAGLGKKCGALTVLDNTFAGLFAHKDIPIDLYVHSLTKQACGHSDAMGGAVIGSKSLLDQLYPISMTLGGCLDPHSAWLILRGLKTYSLRTNKASETAFELAKWLETKNWVKNLRYPGLKSHPDHSLWLKQGQGDGGSVVTFDLDTDLGGVDRFFDELKLFTVAPSLGCVESLAAPCLLLFGDDLSEADARDAGITPTTVRLAVGIEHFNDLKNDVEQAAQAARK